MIAIRNHPMPGGPAAAPVGTSPAGQPRWLRALTALLLLAAAAAALVLAAPAGAASGPDRPNILVVLTDDQTFESLGRMPHVSARSDWVRFDNAFLNTPVCCPTRATLLNGRHSHENRVLTNFDGWKFKDRSSVATWLQDAGYRTAFFGKYLNGYPWSWLLEETYVPPGWDRWMAFNGTPDYYDYALNERGPGGPTTTATRGRAAADYSTDVIARNVRAYIERSAKKRAPFLAFASFFAPHGSNGGEIGAPRHAGAFTGMAVPQPPSFNEADVSDKPAWVAAQPLRDPEAMAEGRRRQYRSLLAVDEAVSGFFTALAETDQLRRTAVVFLSDNGFNWGEHRMTGKGCAYEECIRTPLLIRQPGVAGRSEQALVSSVDIAPTIARWAGVRPPRSVDGRSLGRLLRGERARVHRAILLRGKRPRSQLTQPPSFWGVRTTRFKYVESPEGVRELYDLENDPFELRNVIDVPAFAQAVEDLDRKLTQLRFK